jgi:2-(1,2-epoxy-1,2-dihydrophenyl)acetyl-CoA isomerase
MDPLNDEGRAVRLRKEDGLAIMTLNRPDKYNCWNGEMYEQLDEAVDDITHDDSVRCVIVTGAGGNFSSGGDLAWYREQRAAAFEKDRFFQYDYPSYRNMDRLKMPVIAAIDGQCLMAGLNFASFFCDIRIASERAKFSFALPRTGGEPMGGMGNLGQYATPYTWHMSLGNVLYLAAAGGTFDAERAFIAGLVQEVVPAQDLMSRAIELARRIASFPPDRISSSKELYKRYLEFSGAPFERLQELIERPTVSLEGTKNYLEHTSRYTPKK